MTASTEALQALARLQEGNKRFLTAVKEQNATPSEARRHTLASAEEQKPFAIILGCSDSRVPAEIVFDQGPGDLFVIRVAGNVVAPSQVESVEFAAEAYNTRLVVVLGHTNCGAIDATVEQLLGKDGNGGKSVFPAITDRIRPSVVALLATDLVNDKEALARQAVRSNICMSADHLRNGSRILERLVKQDGLLVVGAEYSLETGAVEFFDGLP